MSQPKPELALRYRGGDRHHLFLNHGTWFLRYSVREAPWLKADRRVAVSLGTKDLDQAKERRDAVLAHLQFHAAVTADAVIDFNVASKVFGLHAAPGSSVAEAVHAVRPSSPETPASATGRTVIARQRRTARSTTGDQLGFVRCEGRAA